MITPDPKAHSQARFSQYAQGYVNSPTHSQGYDLDLILELAAPQPDWVALDVATGGGHTALKIAPHVAKMIASDYAPVMLAAAREFIIEKGATNVEFAEADAENLPFEDGMFNLVTCRIAAHHFPDPFKFAQEVARVLKPDGVFILQDQTVSDDKPVADFVEAFESLRDPSHVRALPAYEWEGTCLDAGLVVDQMTTLQREAPMLAWAERQGCTPEVIERLQIMMIQAPAAVAEWMKISHAGTSDALFYHTYVTLKAHKPTA